MKLLEMRWLAAAKKKVRVRARAMTSSLPFDAKDLTGKRRREREITQGERDHKGYVRVVGSFMFQVSYLYGDSLSVSTADTVE